MTSKARAVDALGGDASIWIAHESAFVREALSDVFLELGYEVYASSDLVHEGGSPRIILASGRATPVDLIRERWPDANLVEIAPLVSMDWRGPTPGLMELCAASGIPWADSRMPVGEMQTPQSLAGPTLTKRQREVMTLVAEGWTSKAIAESLHLQPGTIERHKRAAVAALGVTTLGEAMALFADSALRKESH